jgi:uncharacterized membrane protein (DUF441 family)
MLYKIIILALVIISFITKNKNLGIAALIVFAVSISGSEKLVNAVEKYCMDIGMIFLMMWMLIPLIKMETSNGGGFKSLLTLNGAVSFLAGVVVVLLAAKGVDFTKGSADVLSGVVIGSIVGVSLLGGVPVGPLIASGIAYEIVKLINIIFGNK